MTRPVGRPRFTLETIKERLGEHWKEKILDEYSDGAADMNIAAMIGICRDTFYTHLSEIPEFMDTIKKGRVLSENWWTRHAQKELHNKDFNSTLWMMNMSNRFKWNSSKEVKDHTGEVKVNFSFVDGIKPKFSTKD